MRSFTNAFASAAERLINALHLKSVLRPFYYRFYKNRLNKRSQLIMQEKGLSVLRDFHDCLTSHGIPYTLAFGTLLGAVREKGFIKHDLDIDVFMWKEFYTPEVDQILQDAGFVLSHSFYVDNGDSGLERTYEKSGVHIDVFFIYPAIDQYPYCCDFLAMEYSSFSACMQYHGYVQVRRIEMPFVKERKLAKFEDIDLYIPLNAEELVAFRYGDDYMIPNPNWGVQSHNEHIIVWEGKKAYFIEN